MLTGELLTGLYGRTIDPHASEETTDLLAADPGADRRAAATRLSSCGGGNPVAAPLQREGRSACPPGGSKQQTGALVGDFDRDGIKEFILSFRQKPPALVWYRRAAGGWMPGRSRTST